MVKKLLEWIYSGDTILPYDMEEVIMLSELADKFSVIDLSNRCQEDVINHTNIDNVIDTLCEHSVPNFDSSNYILSESTLDHCKSFFLNEYQEIQLADNQVEEKICKVPGLVSSLLIHKIEHKQFSKKESKVTFSLTQNEIPSELPSDDR